MADASSMARARAQPDFRAYSSNDQIPNAQFYFIESTAPDNVEQSVDLGGSSPKGLTYVDPDQAVQEIAETLTPASDPEVGANLVVMVHGFNTPRDRALEFYAKALAGLENDRDKLFGDGTRRTVCMAYRWPSERIGSVLSSSLSALPALPLIIVAASALAIALCVWLLAAVLKFAGLIETELAHHLLARIIVVCGLVIFTCHPRALASHRLFPRRLSRDQLRSARSR